MTQLEVLHWLYAIETAANDAMEEGDHEAQNFFVEWWDDFRQDGCA